ncbi:MAG: hypothetical protein E6R05_00420 [Candidatus Moraniibacteriota bacterium]|nr:MAG: hypothetical protein E6R05_00420 [Candidatus Moranbacteria bacterium]
MVVASTDRIITGGEHFETYHLPEDTRLTELRDFDRPARVETTLTSSFSVTQNEVRSMLDVIRGEGHPVGWYELAQGIMEWFDPTKGFPQINIWMEGVDSPVLLRELAGKYKKKLRQMGPEGIKPLLPKIKRVKLSDRFSGDSALSPAHIVLTDHDDRGRETELSRHGRGTSITVTTFMAGNLAKDMVVQSCLPDHGTYVARVRMQTVPYSRDKKAMSVIVRSDPTLVMDETAIEVVEPGEDLIIGLIKLEDDFLLANPVYDHNLLYPKEKESKTAILFSKRVDEMTQGDREKMFGNKKVPTNARVEILDKDVLGITGDIDYVFVNGLKIKTPGINWRMATAFWGLDDANYGYNPGRSNDSLSLVGEYKEVLRLVYGYCDKPEIWSEILQEGMIEEMDYYKTKSMAELQAIPYSFMMNEDVDEALQQGWKTAMKAFGIANNEVFSASMDTKTTHNNIFPNTPVRMINSQIHHLLKLKINNYPDALDAVTKAQEKAGLEKRDRLLKQKAAEDKAKQQVWDQVRGRTGVVKIREDQAETELVRDRSGEPELLIGALARILLLTGGVLRVDPKLKEIRVVSGGALTIPNIKNEIPSEMRALTLTLLSTGRLESVSNRYFDFRGSGRGFLSLLEESDSGDNRILITKKEELDNQVFGNQSHVSLRFHDNLDLKETMRGLAQLLGRDKKLELAKYQNSHWSKDQNVEMALLTRKLEQQRTKMLSEINSMRVAHGLPQLSLETAPSTSIEAPQNKKSAKKANKKEKTEAQISYHFQAPFDGVLRLIHPESHFVSQYRSDLLTETVSRSDLTLFQQIRAFSIRKFFERMLKRSRPDYELAGMGLGKESGYLIFTMDGVSLEDYVPYNGVSFGQSRGKPHLRSNLALDDRLQSVPIIPGHKPVGVYHPLGKTIMDKIKFSVDPNHGLYAMSIKGGLRGGLEVYYEKSEHVDTTQPTVEERTPIALFDQLRPEWQALINKVNQDESLDDKQKSDIMYSAWVRVFRYTHKGEEKLLYNDLVYRPDLFRTAVINNGMGKCGHAGEGWCDLQRFVGLAAREVAGAMSPATGKFFADGNNHFIGMVFLDGHWVACEAQANYIDKDYNIAGIPNEYTDLIDKLSIEVGEKQNLAINNKESGKLPSYLRDMESFAMELADAIGDVVPLLTKPMQLARVVLLGLNQLGYTPQIVRAKKIAGNLAVVGVTGLGISMLVGHDKVTDFVTAVSQHVEILTAQIKLAFGAALSEDVTMRKHMLYFGGAALIVGSGLVGTVSGIAFSRSIDKWLGNSKTDE